MNTRELARSHPEAFAALPEAYQNDDCLTFWEIRGKLYAQPANGQELALGKWVARYHSDKKEWTTASSVFPSL